MYGTLEPGRSVLLFKFLALVAQDQPCNVGCLASLAVAGADLFFAGLAAEAADVLHQLLAQDVAGEGRGAVGEEENLRRVDARGAGGDPRGREGAGEPFAEGDQGEVTPGMGRGEELALRPHVAEV